MERRGRIPVAKFRRAEGKSRSGSRVRDVNHNDSDPEMDMFTMLEENFALKEENKNLNTKISEYEQNVKALEDDNLQLRIQIKTLNDKKPEKLIELNAVSTQTIQDSNSMISNKRVTKKNDFQNSENNSSEQLLITDKETRDKIKGILDNMPCTNEFESLLEIQNDKQHSIPVKSILSLIDELSQLRTNFNNIELQLYEANEKISDLLEQQTILEEENIALKMRNNLGNNDNNNGLNFRDPSLMQKACEEIPEYAVVKQKSERTNQTENSCSERRIVEVFNGLSFWKLVLIISCPLIILSKWLIQFNNQKTIGLPKANGK